MENIVLYCKSYRGDLNRVVNLVRSIQSFNKDSIPVYISVPKEDLSLFKANVTGVNFLDDEEVYEGTAPGWIQQQIVKSSFWKLGIAANYVCLDSDASFIRSFGVSDFIYENDVPYTIIHEQKELFTWTVSKVNILGFDPRESYIKDRTKIMNLFQRKGKYYDFGPVPTIWSSKVWRDLEDNYIVPNNLSFPDLLEYSPSEFSWYGEALLHYKSIPIYPSEPIFKVFHYPQQLQEYKQQNITQEMIAQNYLGVVMQSNFNATLNYV